eukprot:COSAG03_NODE_2348_length_2862_cov_1.593920_2_plen_97_part_00
MGPSPLKAEKKQEQTTLDAEIALQNVNQLIKKLKSTPLGELGQNSVDMVMSFIRSMGADMNDIEGMSEEVANARLALIRTLDMLQVVGACAPPAAR